MLFHFFPPFQSFVTSFCPRIWCSSSAPDLLFGCIFYIFGIYKDDLKLRFLLPITEWKRLCHTEAWINNKIRRYNWNRSSISAHVRLILQPTVRGQDILCGSSRRTRPQYFFLPAQHLFFPVDKAWVCMSVSPAGARERKRTHFCPWHQLVPQITAHTYVHAAKIITHELM